MIVSVIGGGSLASAAAALLLAHGITVQEVTVEETRSAHDRDILIIERYGYALEPVSAWASESNEAEYTDPAPRKESAPCADAIEGSDARHNTGSPGRMEYG